MSAGTHAPLTAGVDIGTQSVRVVLLEEDGRVASFGDAPLESDRSDGGRHQQNPESWWKAFCEASK